VALPGLGNDINAGLPDFRKAQRWECQPSRFAGLTRPALGDGVLPRRYA